MEDIVLLTYKWCRLDKRHEYGISNLQTDKNQWVWYYIGNLFKFRKNEELYPYDMSDNGTGKVKILGKYSINDAKKRAECIIRAIKRNRSRRKRLVYTNRRVSIY